MIDWLLKESKDLHSFVPFSPTSISNGQDHFEAEFVTDVSKNSGDNT